MTDYPIDLPLLIDIHNDGARITKATCAYLDRLENAAALLAEAIEATAGLHTGLTLLRVFDNHEEHIPRDSAYVRDLVSEHTTLDLMAAPEHLRRILDTLNAVIRPVSALADSQTEEVEAAEKVARSAEAVAADLA
jgi:hypothetical protein